MLDHIHTDKKRERSCRTMPELSEATELDSKIAEL